MGYDPEIEKILDQIQVATENQTEMIKAAWWHSFDGGQRGVRSEAKITAWYASQRTSHSPVWDAVHMSAWDAAHTRSSVMPDWWPPKGAAWNVARDALLAIVVKDLITEDQYQLLHGLWSSVMD